MVTPGRCWLPPALAEGRRLWGIAAQLYLLRSASDWGIGDFGDLRSLVELAAARGADVIGLNPLHAMFPDNPEHASPYSPASRLLLNILNIDVTAVPELLDCPETRELIASEAFRQELCRRAAPSTWWTTPRSPRSSCRCWKSCSTPAAVRPIRPAGSAFEAFRRERGEVLERNCLFLALREHFAGRRPVPGRLARLARGIPRSGLARGRTLRARRTGSGWISSPGCNGWPTSSSAPRQRRPRERGMAVGLYRDLAVGADRAGAETWANAAAVVSGAQVGAPPDIYNPAGQDWGLPPFHPRALREEGYRSFIELVRANMRHAGGLRIDHVMGLQHLYWVPQGQKPAAGAYVAVSDGGPGRHPRAGEPSPALPRRRRGSRHRAGGFPRAHGGGEHPFLSRAVLRAGAETGAFLPPQRLSGAGAGRGRQPRPADLARLVGGARPRAQGAARPVSRSRARPRGSARRASATRRQLLQALRREGLLPTRGEPDIPALARAAHAFLARTPSVLAMAQIDDLTDEADPVNVPATSDEHPNWRRRLSMTLEELAARPRFIDIAEIFRRRARQHQDSCRNE